MGLYDTFRFNGGPTLYGPNKTAVTADVLEIGFIFAALILFVSLIIVLPSVRGKEIVFTAIKIFVGVFITAGIFLANFGQEWESAYLHTKTQYRSGIKKEIEADIGVKIGLRSVNITLKTDPVEQVLEVGIQTETINYNERFSWNQPGWTLGRIGFGQYAGLFNRQFRDAQVKGLPYPILWIAEYFTIDGEGIRWGRHYLQAGYFTHIAIWTAFPLWIISLIVFPLVVRYGGYFMTMTGGVMLLGNIIYASIRNRNDLVIPFEDGKLEFHWGSTFYLNLVVGMICVILGVIVVVMDMFFKEYLATFLDIDVIQDYQEYYASGEELANAGVKVITHDRPTGKSIYSRARPEMANGHTKAITNDRSAQDPERLPSDDMDDPDEVYENPEVVQRLFRKKVGWATRGTIVARIAKSRKTKPRPTPTFTNDAHDDDADGLYANTQDAASIRAVRFQGQENVAFEEDDDKSKKRYSKA